jgi:RsiW-degrading membrane proteinase PrsW (M82 family)
MPFPVNILRNSQALHWKMHQLSVFSDIWAVTGKTITEMNKLIPTLLRITGVFAVFAVLQYFIVWYLLVPTGLVAGLFMHKTSDDRPMTLGLIIGSILFGIFAYFMSKIYPSAG